MNADKKLSLKVSLKTEPGHGENVIGIVEGGDPVQSAVNRLALRGPCYRLEESIVVKNAPVIEIYRRTGGACGVP